MALPYVDISSPIINAYLQGRRLRMAQEEMQRDEQFRRDKMAQESEEFKQQEKLRRDTLKQQFDIESQQMAQQKAQFDALHNLRLADRKLQIQEALAQGITKYPQQRENWAQQEDKFTKAPYTDSASGITIQPNEYYTPEEHAQILQQQSLAKVTPQIDIANIQAEARNLIEGQRQNFSRTLEETRQAHRLKLADLHSQLKGTKDDISASRRLQALQHIYDKVDADDVTKQFKKLAGGMEYINKMETLYPSLESPSIDDWRLLFNLVKGFDDTAVRDSERKDLLSAAQPVLTRYKLGFNRFWKYGPLFSPQARRTIVTLLKEKYNAQANSYNEVVNTAIQRGKDWDPNLDEEKVRNNLYKGTEVRPKTKKSSDEYENIQMLGR